MGRCQPRWIAIRRRPKHSAAPMIVVAVGGRCSRLANHHHRSAGQRCDRVKVGAQDRGNFGQEDVAHHAAADAGQHPEQRRHDGIEPERERLLRA